MSEDGFAVDKFMTERAHDVGAVHDQTDVTWELSKENVLPLARGRKADSIKRAFGHMTFSMPSGFEPTSKIEKGDAVEFRESAGTSSADTLLNLKRCYEPLVESSLGQVDNLEDDPLMPWLDYIKAVQDSLPTDQQGQFELLERCSRRFRGDERYKNDLRYLKVWMAYANHLTNPDDLCRFLYKRGIGLKHALFWVNWATFAEKAGKFPFVEKLYAKAIDRLAQPRNIIKNRQREFLRRMRRMWINRQLEDGVEADLSEDMPEEEDGRRLVLQTLSASEAGRNQRRDSDIIEPSRQGITGLGGRRGNTGADLGDYRDDQRSESGSWRRWEKIGRGIIVFVEAEFEAGVLASSRREKGDRADDILEDRTKGTVWADYGSRESREQENIAQPSRWGEAGLSHRGEAPRATMSNRHRWSSLPSADAAFSVFVDGQDSDDNEALWGGKDRDMFPRVDPHKDSQGTDRNLRSASSVEQDVEEDEEEQVEEGRARHMESGSLQPTIQHGAKRKDDHAPSAVHDEEDVPIGLRVQEIKRTGDRNTPLEGHIDDLSPEKATTTTRDSTEDRATDAATMGIADTSQEGANIAEVARVAIGTSRAGGYMLGGGKGDEIARENLSSLKNDELSGKLKLKVSSALSSTSNEGGTGEGSGIWRNLHGVKEHKDQGMNVQGSDTIPLFMSLLHATGSWLSSSPLSLSTMGAKAGVGRSEQAERLGEDDAEFHNTIQGDGVTINTRLALKTVDEWFAGPVEEAEENNLGIVKAGYDSEAGASEGGVEHFEVFWDPDGGIGHTILHELERRSSKTSDGDACGGHRIGSESVVPDPNNDMENQENVDRVASLQSRNIHETRVEASALRELGIPSPCPSDSTQECEADDDGSTTTDPSLVFSSSGNEEQSANGTRAAPRGCQRPISLDHPLGRDGSTRDCHMGDVKEDNFIDDGNNDAGESGVVAGMYIDEELCLPEMQVLNDQSPNSRNTDGENGLDRNRRGKRRRGFGSGVEDGVRRLGLVANGSKRAVDQQMVLVTTHHRPSANAVTLDGARVPMSRGHEAGGRTLTMSHPAGHRTTNAEVLRQAGIRPRWPPVPSLERKQEGAALSRDIESVHEGGPQAKTAPHNVSGIESFAIYQGGSDVGGDDDGDDDAAEHPAGLMAGGERSRISPVSGTSLITTKPLPSFTIFTDRAEVEEPAEGAFEGASKAVGGGAGPRLAIFNNGAHAESDDLGADSKVEDLKGCARHAYGRKAIEGSRQYRLDENYSVTHCQGYNERPPPIHAESRSGGGGSTDSELSASEEITWSLVGGRGAEFASDIVACPVPKVSSCEEDLVAFDPARSGKCTPGLSVSSATSRTCGGRIASSVLTHGKEWKHRSIENADLIEFDPFLLGGAATGVSNLLTAATGGE